MRGAEATTAFERLGGEQVLRPIVDAFVDRLFDDPMIGYMFPRPARARIKRFEYEHAAEFLGAPIVYQGRALEEAHAPHRIMGGQFLRRKEILRQTLVAHHVPEDIRVRWLSHVDALRPLITRDRGSECGGTAS